MRLWALFGLAQKKLEMPCVFGYTDPCKYQSREAFRVSASKHQKQVDRKRKIRNAQRRIRHRLRERTWIPQELPMFRARNIHYEVADKTRGLACGGIGAMHATARAVGLIEALDRHL